MRQIKPAQLSFSAHQNIVKLTYYLVSYEYEHNIKPFRYLKFGLLKFFSGFLSTYKIQDIEVIEKVHERAAKLVMQ